jgi:predicted RNase H-like nuclease (RuvC/YqgF family)
MTRDRLLNVLEDHVTVTDPTQPVWGAVLDAMEVALAEAAEAYDTMIEEAQSREAEATRKLEDVTRRLTNTQTRLSLVNTRNTNLDRELMELHDQITELGVQLDELHSDALGNT